MNKRANLYLNIYSSITLLLGIVCIGYSLTLKEVSFSVPTFFRTSIFCLGMIGLLLCLSIELFLFLLLKNKIKGMDILIILVSLLFLISINKIAPFSGFLIAIFYGFSKDIIRVLLVDKIYIPKEFNRYCKMFNIKINDFSRKKKSTKPRKKEYIKIQDDELVDKVKKKTTKKSTQKEATI